jgi:hypothetical protein
LQSEVIDIIEGGSDVDVSGGLFHIPSLNTEAFPQVKGATTRIG